MLPRPTRLCKAESKQHDGYGQGNRKADHDKRKDQCQYHDLQDRRANPDNVSFAYVVSVPMEGFSA